MAIPDQPTNTDVPVLHLKITNHSDVQIPLIPLWAEKFGTIDLKFYGVPIEVRQKGKVLLYGIFRGDTYERVGIPRHEFFRCHFNFKSEVFISPVFLGAPVTS